MCAYRLFIVKGKRSSLSLGTPVFTLARQRTRMEKRDPNSESDNGSSQTVKLSLTSTEGNTLKYASLLVLTIQNAVLILSMRYSRTLSGDMFITTTAVVLSETLKMVTCLVIIFLQKQNWAEFTRHLYESIILDWRDTLKMSVPAIVYALQNNLQYVAVSNLGAAVFQVTYQMKILTTALFSVLLLGKRLTGLQWGSLVTLFVGVAMVQLSSKATERSSQEQHQLLGLAAVILSCLSSGFAGVYFEKMLKGSSASVWLRNVQLGLFGSLSALIGMFAKDWDAIYENGFFFGYSPLVVTVVVQQAVGGLVVAVVVKYADNILKGFATSLSIIISCIAAVFFFKFQITFTFTIGAAFVMVAIYLYGKPQAPSKTLSSTLPTTATSRTGPPTT